MSSRALAPTSRVTIAVSFIASDGEMNAFGLVAAAQTGAPKVATEFCGKKLAAGIALGMLGETR